jgi:hypothetical protein
MSRQRINPVMLVAVAALVVALMALTGLFARGSSPAPSPSGPALKLGRSAPSPAEFELASSFAVSGGGTPYFVRKTVAPSAPNKLFLLIAFKNNGIIRGACTSSLVGLQYKNNTANRVDIWIENLDAASDGYSGGPWYPGGTGGESYTGAITWLVNVAAGTGSTAQYASFIVTGFHDGPHSGCNFQFQGTATMGITHF